jgi:predicted component of type VI protein secretion system
MRAGPTPGKVFTLTKTEIYIGRDISNDIVINDSEVSRKHVRLMMQAGQYVLEDLGSTNGTFINNQRIAGPHILGPNQVVQMGENVTVVFEAVASSDPDATAVMSKQSISSPPAPAAAPAAPTPAPVPAYASPAVEPDDDDEEGGNRKWIIGGCGCLVVVACVAVLAYAFYIDSNSLWCDSLFSFVVPGC